MIDKTAIINKNAKVCSPFNIAIRPRNPKISPDAVKMWAAHAKALFIFFDLKTISFNFMP